MIGVESAIGKAIQTRIVRAPAGYASKQDTGIKTVPRKETTEEEHPAMEEAETNQIQDKGTSPNRGEIHLIQRKTKAESPTGITRQKLTTLTNQDQLTMIDQADQDQDLDQTMMKNHLKEERSLRESQAEAATTVSADTFPYCFLDDDSDSENENVNYNKEEENPDLPRMKRTGTRIFMA